ncbi:A/G-specific adenine glycosylase [Sphingomonas sp. GlSt437]|uniref:A/G-specific adenine glycosylase n=1 Tax=Sphingomonas sp. GlSt437 TaxID=3389970 RepID=UPI003A84ABBB
MLAKPAEIAPTLLAWYDAHARDLPWRVKNGATADPYRVWLSEIMLQQTTVATVRTRYAAFLERWPTVADLAAADDAELMSAWAGLGYYARARNLLACARAVVADHGGHFPSSEAVLRALPGIGDYTAAAIAAIAFGKRAVVVDGNVARVVARLFALAEPLPGARNVLHQLTDAITPAARAGDFAQAMMDLGAMVCTPRRPTCALCPLRPQCSAADQGTPEAYPVKAAKVAKPQRYGTAFWIERDEKVLLVRRPAKGLLGGMRALPTGAWSDEPPGLAGAPDGIAHWRLGKARVDHVFTHFRLQLALAIGEAPRHAPDPTGEWWPIADIESAGLPTVFAKVARLRRDA